MAAAIRHLNNSRFLPREVNRVRKADLVSMKHPFRGLGEADAANRGSCANVSAAA
jgi:hypothetical protein